MAALVRENRIQREILWISVPFKRFRVNDQQIIPRLSCQPVLGAARLAVHVAIPTLPNKAQACRGPGQPLSSAQLRPRLDGLARIATRLGFVGQVEYRHVNSQAGGAQYGLARKPRNDLLIVYAEAFE